MYVLETVALRKRQKGELEVEEVKMLRFSLEVMRMDMNPMLMSVRTRSFVKD